MSLQASTRPQTLPRARRRLRLPRRLRQVLRKLGRTPWWPRNSHLGLGLPRSLPCPNLSNPEGDRNEGINLARKDMSSIILGYGHGSCVIALLSRGDHPFLIVIERFKSWTKFRHFSYSESKKDQEFRKLKKFWTKFRTWIFQSHKEGAVSPRKQCYSATSMQALLTQGQGEAEGQERARGESKLSKASEVTIFWGVFVQACESVPQKKNSSINTIYKNKIIY